MQSVDNETIAEGVAFLADEFAACSKVGAAGDKGNHSGVGTHRLGFAQGATEDGADEGFGDVVIPDAEFSQVVHEGHEG